MTVFHQYNNGSLFEDESGIIVFKINVVNKKKSFEEFCKNFEIL